MPGEASAPAAEVRPDCLFRPAELGSDTQLNAKNIPANNKTVIIFRLILPPDSEIR